MPLHPGSTLASPNHPNVAQIHGVDQVGDTCFLVLLLELVPDSRVPCASLKLAPEVRPGR